MTLRRTGITAEETKISAAIPTALWMQAKAQCLRERKSFRDLICEALELSLGPLEMPAERSSRIAVEAVAGNDVVGT
jgi:hypothetical protein